MAASLDMQDGDLIDLNVGSPVFQRALSEGVVECTSESLLDSELPILEKKLQISGKNNSQPPNTCPYVDVEDILITIDGDNEITEASTALSLPESNSLPFHIKKNSIEELENLEVLDILTKLDELLNETLAKSDSTIGNCGLMHGESSDTLNELENKSIEDCLEDLDNYLKEIDTSSSESHDSSTETDTPGSSAESRTSTVLSSSSPLTEEVVDSTTSGGHVNLAYEDTENLLPLIRSTPLRATIAGIGRPALQRSTVRRRSLDESPGYCASVRISETAGDLSTEVDLNSLQECRSYPPGDCSTGTVVVEFTHNADGNNHESSWLRTSMRRIRHLRLPSNETPGDTEIVVSDVSEMVPPRIEVSQCYTSGTETTTTVRPFSAPSRLTNAATQSSVRTTRDSRRNTVTREPGGRNRSTSRSRRQRSLSSSESSLTSSVYTTPSCTPAPTPTRNNQEATSTTNVRRPCDRSRTNDMPEAESPLGHWPHSLSSMLACVGCTVGLFNISRFAILSTHFGANFIIQFFLLSLVIGLPLFTLQLCLGQQLGAGVIDMWRISPLFQGVGVALLVSQALIGLYSIIGVSWLFVYFRDSFITKDDRYRWAEPYYYYRDFNPNDNGSNYNNVCETVPDYFSGIVLQRHHLKSGAYSGTIKFQLAFNLAVVWMIVFVSLSKGLRSYGKVVYVFSLLPVFGIFVVSAKVLSMIPSDFVYVVFPETSWSEFFLNSRSWVAASQEVLLTWGLLGAATMQIASHNKNKHLLQRDSSLIAIITFAILLLTAFLANTCVQLLRSHGYIYMPSSFEKIGSYSFLQSSDTNLPTSFTTIPVRYMPHQSFIVGGRVTKNGIDTTMESGYQALRLATELVPATFAVMGTEEIYPFWAVLFYFILILFGIAQQLAIWHCVITGIMAIKANLLKSWETTITFFSCACGFLLGLPMATEYGVYMVYFMDFTIGGMWWLILIILLEIVAVFMVRGRPYSGDALVNTFFASQSRPCLLTWAPALLSFTWNVILPVGLMVCCVAFFKNGNFRELFVWHHAPSFDYWPLWARQIGSMLQLLPVLCVPIVAVVQSYRYLNNGPADILDRVQLLYRPPIGEHMEDIPIQATPQSTATGTTTVGTAVIGIPATVASAEDPPPKYTPPPSYTTATGARIAKFLRQSIRRSVRRLTNALGEGSSRNRTNPQPLQIQVPPPDYTDVLVEMNQSHNTSGLSTINVISSRNDTNLSSFGRELAEHRRSSSGVLTIADVASILRNSFRRSRIRSANTTRNPVTSCDSNDASISAQNLVDSAAPIGETSLVLDNISNGEGEAKLQSDNLSAVI